MTTTWITVAETAAYLSQAKTVLNDANRAAIIDLVSTDPMCGILIAGTGGVRKVRFALPGRGKSGGVRVVYFYHDDAMPLYLLAVFAKSERASLTKAECNALQKLTTVLVTRWKDRADG